MVRRRSAAAARLAWPGAARAARADARGAARATRVLPSPASPPSAGLAPAFLWLHFFLLPCQHMLLQFFLLQNFCMAAGAASGVRLATIVPASVARAPRRSLSPPRTT